MNFLDEKERPRIGRIKIPQYYNKKKKENVDRTIHAQPGMAELVNIVAGLQKDVRRINKCLTLEGAQEYVKDRAGWNAFEEDITGPDGHPDGIPEVLVTDAYGNIKVINGYGLRKGTYTQRKLFQFMKRRIEKDNPDVKYTYGAFRNDVNRIHKGWDENGGVAYSCVLPDDAPAYFKDNLPRPKAPTAKDLFKQHIFNPVYEEHKVPIKEAAKANIQQPGMVCAQINTTAFRESYKEFVLKPVYQALGADLDELSQEGQEKAKRKFDKDNKEGIARASMDMVKNILSSDEQLNQVQGNINEIINSVAVELLGKARLGEEQLEAFKSRSQSISPPQSQIFTKGPIQYMDWGYVPPADQTEMKVEDLL